MPFLSVIIPVYNVENYLRRCVESLVTQLCFNEIEVLLVDDGSTDHSGAICDEYANKYDNICVFHKKNGGLSHARNYALDFINGTHIFFLDSDDIVESSFLYDIKKNIENYNPSMICFKCSYERKIGKYKIVGNKKITISENRSVLDDLLKNKMVNQICFNIYAKSLFEKVRFPNGRSYEDIATLYKLILQANKIIKVNYTYYIYNLSNMSSITKISSFKNINDMYLSVNEQVSAIENYYKKIGKSVTNLHYYRIDKYVYIYMKLLREVAESEESNNLKTIVGNWLANNYCVNLLIYRNYNLKKYCYFVIVLLPKIRSENKNSEE